jgi:hypothetical protein
LIINHVKAMARKVDEMVVHEKYRPEHELGESIIGRHSRGRERV